MAEKRKKYGFGKAEKLCSQRTIDELFNTGNSLFVSNFRMIYLEKQESGHAGIKVLISVPKKILRHAVSRNRMKRLIREAFRLHKLSLQPLLDVPGRNFYFAIIYTGRQTCTLPVVETAINELFGRLTKIYETTAR
jgi:ribonuclease P protein component